MENNPRALDTAVSNKTIEEVMFEESWVHDKILITMRCLIADLCQQYNGGHPGGAMSMAAIGLALYLYSMVYSPTQPDWINRDRLVLSNGHTCLWQYILMHLTGSPGMTMEQLKSYHSMRTDSLCPGHPQIHHDGVEVTTGPLGQGVANAVGLAVASKHLATVYNRPECELLNNMTWCTIGDACLQEGVALEAIQLAGHWRLDNLAIIYDNNQVTCDGTLDVTCTEDINTKMRACGWTVIDVFDGVSNIQGIVHALTAARSNRNQPTFINIRTIIGYGSLVEGQAIAHGEPLGTDGVAAVKKRFGKDYKQHFEIAPEIYTYFHRTIGRGKGFVSDFRRRLSLYEKKYPQLASEFRLRMDGNMSGDWRNHFPLKREFPDNDGKYPTRKAAHIICGALAKHLNNFMVGTANLREAVNMSWDGHVAFQHPALQTTCGLSGNYTGRYLHFGIREHAMASVANGLAAFKRGTIIPMTSGFFMFYIYAAAGVRMGAIQGLQAIHIATHDSIALGDDGPAHHPIELAALFRAMPNLLYVRPCDSEETCGAFIIALEARTTPTMISLSRHDLKQYYKHSCREGVQRGAYVFIEESEGWDLTLIGVGSEMVYAVDARSKLKEIGINARVVSFPCQRLFDIQSQEYKESVMQYKQRKLAVVIEAYAVNGWERYADAGYSMNSFGKSLPADTEIYSYFGFEATAIADKLKELVEEIRVTGVESLRGHFRELNGGPMGYGWNPL